MKRVIFKKVSKYIGHDQRGVMSQQGIHGGSNLAVGASKPTLTFHNLNKKKNLNSNSFSWEKQYVNVLKFLFKDLHR